MPSAATLNDGRPRAGVRLLVAALSVVAVLAGACLATPANAGEATPAAARQCSGTLSATEKTALLKASASSTATDLTKVRAQLSTITTTFNARGDARGTFPLVYDVIVARTQDSIRAGKFADPGWAERLAVRFSGEYLDNLRLHLQGRAPTPYWAEYYRLAGDCEHNLARVVAQGIVTHLVDDLPRVLTQVGTKRSHKADYDIYGASLVAAAPGLGDLFDATYGVDISQPLQLWFLGDMFGPETVNQGLFGLVRTFAWINYLKLVVSPWWGRNGIDLTWLAGSGAIGVLEHLGVV